jgi:MoaA/NifB/PqqE/SkfB family radical SAM enzyme
VELVLSSMARYRREWFGCVVVDLSNKSTRFFNRSAAFIIEQFFEPTDEARLSFPEGLDGDAFVASLESSGLLRPAALDSGIDASAAFHLDCEDFLPGNFHSPLGLEVELTRKCSRKCTYCSYDSSPTYDTSGELSTSQWKSVLTNAARSGVLFVRFTGGDPMLRPDFWEIAAYASSQGLLVTIGSDLTRFVKADCDRLASLTNLYCIHTTLDGPDRETADKLRGNGNFEKVTRAVALLRQFEVPFLISMVVTRANVDRVFETATLARTLGAKYFVASPLYAAGRGCAVEPLIPTADQLKSIAEQLKRAGFASHDHQRPNAALHSAGLDEPAESDEDWLALPTGMRAADRFMRIDPRGQCYLSIKAVQQLGIDAMAGDATLDRIDMIWRNSELLCAVRQLPGRDTRFGRIVDIKSLSTIGRRKTHEAETQAG